MDLTSKFYFKFDHSEIQMYKSGNSFYRSHCFQIPCLILNRKESAYMKKEMAT